MRVPVILMLATMAASCAASQIPRLQEVRAPPGWESFCFPVPLRFVGDGEAVSTGSRELLSNVADIMGFRNYRWFNLSVAAGGSASRPAPHGLPQRRARAVLRLLPALGIDVDRVQIVFEPDLPALASDGANFSVMISPEQVEALRVRREVHGIIAC